MKPGTLPRLAAVAALALTLVVGSAARAELFDDVPGGTINWTDGVITVKGTGVMPEAGSLAQKRMMGYRAAIADAYRKLAEAVDGVRVDADTTVSNYVTTSDVVRTQVSALIKGAQATKTDYKPDGAVEVTLTLDLHGKNRSLASALAATASPPAPVASVGVVPVPAAPVSLAAATPAPVKEDYTGVIIDAKGLKAEPAMSPSLLDESGEELYLADLSVSPDTVIERGLASYAKSVDEAKTLKTRIGKKPLILKAKAVRGPQRADLVLDRAAAGLLLGADQRKAFLSTLSVVIVL
jgi:hypothetical protein